MKLENQLWESVQVAVKGRDKMEVKGKDSVSPAANISHTRSSNQVEDFVEEVLFSGPPRTELTDKLTIEESLVEALKDYESLKEAKKKIIKKRNKKLKQTYRRTRNEAANAPQRVTRESIMILPRDSLAKG